MPQLDISHWVSQIFWLIFTFAFMYMLMTILVLPRMKNISDRREQKISGDLKRAEEITAEVESIIKDAQSHFVVSQSEADAILAKASQDAIASTESRVAEATKKLDAKVSDALQQVESQKNEALKSLDTIVENVAIDTLNRVVSIKDADKAVASALKS